MRRIPHFLFPVLVATILGMIGCAGPRANVSGGQQAVRSGGEVPLRATQNAKYLLLPGDEIEIKYTYHPQFNERMEIPPDGLISVPLVHDVVAAYKPPSELAAFLREAYRGELKNPDIIVILRRTAGQVAFIGGEVRNPQVLSLSVPTTLLQAVVRCGDMPGSANENEVLVLRASPGQAPQVLVVDLELVREGQAADIMLQSYDVVHVPKTRITKVGDFIEAYINKIIPRSVNFPFYYELHSDKVRIVP